MSNAEPTSSNASGMDGRLVYVVDDESMVGEVVQTVLRMGGYKPVLFSNPELALESIVQARPKPALLLTDFLMSPINGLELIARCKIHLPDLRTILYSGNSREAVLSMGVANPDGFLRKPFLPKTLLGLVGLILPNGAA